MIIDERLTEMNFGLLEGELCSDNFWDIDYDYKSIQGENIPDCQKRVYGFIDDIKEKYKGKNVLIVAHRRNRKNV